MPQIGWFEILIIVSIAIVVVGPKDFPHMLKKIGSWIGSIKRYISNVQDQVSNLEIPTGNPLILEFNSDFKIIKCEYLDKERAKDLLVF